MTKAEIKKQVKEAREKLWRQGDLTWLLEPHQKELYDSFHNLKEKRDKIVVWVANRRSGKSFVLVVIAFETAIKQPKSLIKYSAPQQEQVREILDELIPVILKDCPKDIRPNFVERRNTWYFPNGSKIKIVGVGNKRYNKLRGGCLTSDTNVMTPTGPKSISEMNVGDDVYGYNKDGSVSLTKVKNVFDNGPKEVTELFIRDKYVGSCTDSHQWRTTTEFQIRYSLNKTEKLKTIKDIKNDTRFIKRHIDIPCGTINEPHAYAIGAFIGDGCCNNTKLNQLKLASENILIPNKISEVINIPVKIEKSGKFKSYKYIFSHIGNPYSKNRKKASFNYYKEWLSGKTFKNKNFDWNVVNRWNRESCLQLFAGLLDTDGNVFFRGDNLSLKISSGSLDLLLNVQKLILKLYQTEGSIQVIPKRGKATCIHYEFKITNSYFSRKILKEIDKFILSPQKKFKEKYNNFNIKNSGDWVKVNLGKKYIANTYDIEVDNETNLYLLSSGLVTHNSCHLAIIDEAGFTDDLKQIVLSVIMPSTGPTEGKILLATTPPDETDHEFNFFKEQAEESGNIVVKTIEDYFEAFKRAKKEPKRFTKDIVDDIIKSYGGVDSLEFQREFMCVAITDQTRQIIPEFNLYTEKRIITEVPKPDYYDAYTAMDVGGADLTGLLFAYYDFLNNRVVIEDEGVIERQDAVSDNIADMVADKEAKNWYDPVYNNTITPYKRIADNNNVILLNDLKHIHGIKFTVTEKKEKLNAINQVKLMIKNEQILINPKCVNLINHLRHGKWNKNRTDFARSSKYGHYDLLSALIYLIRNINFNRNPFPSGYIPRYGAVHSAKENNRDSNNAEIMKSLFLRKNKQIR